MPSELVKKINLDQLYLPFTERYLQLLANCDARGARYYSISGYRSVPEQNELYAQGRTKPGQIVTKAKGGQSWHNWGVAGDSCRDKDVTRAGLQMDWDMDSYAILAEEAKKLGLDAGYYWKFKDAPHVQLDVAKHGITLDAVNQIYNKGGIKAVWAYFDTVKW